MSNTISVIIPLYNQMQHLEKCLVSIVKQSSHPLEIVLVNDGSEDAARDEIESKARTAAADVPIKIFHQQNQGAPSARNRGFEKSSGSYVLFCDADIVMNPHMLQTMTETLSAHPDASYAYSSFRFGWKKFRLGAFSEQKLREMPYIHTASLIRREHFPGFDERVSRLQDWDLWLTMLEQGHAGVWIDKVLFVVRSGGTMSRWLPSFLMKSGRGKQSRAYHDAVLKIKSKHGVQ